MDHRAGRARIVVASALLGVLVLSGAAVQVPAQTPEQELEDTRREVEALDLTLTDLVERYEALSARLDRAGSRLRLAERRARSAARELIRRRRSAQALARELYMSGSTADFEALLTSRSLTGLDQAASLLGYAQQSQAKVFEHLRVSERVMSDRVDDLEARFNTIEAATKRLAAIRSAVAGELEDRRADLVRLQNAAARRRLAEAEQANEEIASRSVPQPSPPPPPESTVERHADWDAIAECESGGNWHLDSTYDGGLQFHPDTWLAFGGGKYAAYAWQASRLEQIAIGEKVLAAYGPDAWPNCFVPLED